MSDIFSTPEFESAYTYTGNDLGATWSPKKTVFRLWAPTADAVMVCLYHSGVPDADDLIECFYMRSDRNGTWIAEKSGDLNGVYYTYAVRIGEYIAEACDPYAKTTGVNGQRAMVIDLSATDPDGWTADRDPNAGLNITDAVIYELHIRDLSMDPDSGIKNKGKFLALTEQGTKTPGGSPTGLDHIKSLGITHLHLLPVFDFGSVDERFPETDQYNWGYDPVNFNVPEGSYATDPFDGAVRIREMKQMIHALHQNGISVIMDVVYNHVYHADQFCFNRLVPQYFTRIYDGNYSNGSGCGNDTASERSMVRKYIVDSVCYWADEYHIDGFRFDLVGLLDVDTVNAIVSAVHQRHPNVIFYGEGWNLDTFPTKNCPLATQDHAWMTPGFAYFNDTVRDALRGSVFSSTDLGFVTGAAGNAETLDRCFLGLPSWSSDPKQSINYVSCHDNSTLFDRITLAAPERCFSDRVRMHKLAAAFYLLAQGVPFIHAGEELLRSKPDPNGGYVENSYRSPDSINAIRWSMLEEDIYRQTLLYYKGLIQFRKKHPVLRLGSSEDILSCVTCVPYPHNQIGVYHVRNTVSGDRAAELFFIYSAAETTESVKLPEGKWKLYINGDFAGVHPLKTVSGSVSIPPLSAMVFAKE